VVDRCPICNRRAAARQELPWLTVGCGVCRAFRITVPAAEVVAVYSAAIRQRVSARIPEASSDGLRLDVDLEVLEALARGRTIAGR
jgi:hypothetical protein